MPWLQIDDDAMTRGRTLARLLGVPDAHGIGLCVALWDWALDMAPDGDLRGRIADESPASLCRAAVGWAGEASILWVSYQRIGLIDASGRVKGLHRYDKVLRKRHRDRERLASGPLTNRGGSPRKTETETETETDRKDKSIAGKKPPAPANPRLAQLAKALAAAYLAERGSGYKHGGAKDALALKALLPVGDDDEILRRWVSGLRATGWASCSTFAQLGSKWNDLAAPTTPQKGPIDAASQTHEQTGWVTDDGIIPLESA